jgi:deoxyribonuclease V
MMTDFHYPYDLNINLANLQTELANQVIHEDMAEVTDKIVGVDLSFSKDDRAVAAAVIIQLKSLEIIEKVTREVDLSFPYIPGFLGFREAEAMVKVLRGLESSVDVIMANGHGILHPRGFGLASQVGLVMDLPTIGLAKRLIAGNYIKKDISTSNKGNSLIQRVLLEKKIAGAYVNGYYVSIGHKITLQTAIELVKAISYYKTPEPIRQAHILATQVFKDILNGKSV